MDSNRTRRIVVAGMMSAITVLLSFTPLGLVPWVAGVSLTILTVPAIIGAVLEGPEVGLGIGLVFGLSSLLQAAIAPRSPSDILFINPMVSVLPRLFIGPVAWAAYRALQKLQESVAWSAVGLIVAVVAIVAALNRFSALAFRWWPLVGLSVFALGCWVAYEAGRRPKETWVLIATGAVGSLTNTVLVLSVLGVLGILPWAAIGPIVLANGVPEAIAAAILTSAIVSAWKRIETSQRGSSV